VIDPFIAIAALSRAAGRLPVKLSDWRNCGPGADRASADSARLFVVFLPCEAEGDRLSINPTQGVPRTANDL